MRMGPEAAGTDGESSGVTYCESHGSFAKATTAVQPKNHVDTGARVSTCSTVGATAKIITFASIVLVFIVIPESSIVVVVVVSEMSLVCLLR